MENNDLNQDGKIDDKELKVITNRVNTRKKMAWVSLLSMIFVVISLLYTVDDPTKYESILDLFWIAMGSIVGAYVGIETWMNKK